MRQKIFPKPVLAVRRYLHSTFSFKGLVNYHSKLPQFIRLTRLKKAKENKFQQVISWW
jgi:hypothetical protein